MTDKEKERRHNESEKVTKPAGQDVPPPSNDRVDDEVGSDEKKKTQRQE